MTWSVLVQLLVQFGPAAFDLAKKLIEKWSSTDPVTVADIAELKQLGQRSSKMALVEALVKANIPLDSPQAQQLLSLLA